MWIIGIDPSLTSTGIAILEDRKVIFLQAIKTKPTDENRMFKIAKEFWSIMCTYNNLDVMAMESQFVFHKSNSVLKIVEVRGIIEGIFFANDLRFNKKEASELIVATPMEVKQTMGVNTKLKSKESKKEMRRMVELEYPDLQKRFGRKITQDEIDAIAIALYGYYEKKLSTAPLLSK